MKAETTSGALVALVEATSQDDVVICAARAAARTGQPVVLLRVLPLVERPLRRGPMSAAQIEPWERMEAQERSVRFELEELGRRLDSGHPVIPLVRFGEPVAEVTAAARELGATRVVTSNSRRGARRARE